MLGLPSFLCFVSLIVLAHGTTLQVCQNGCQYSSVTTALQAAQSGDLVYVQTGTYANEAATPVSLLRDITLRGEVGAVVSLSFSNTLNNVWLTINGTLTLEGDLGILINGGRFTNSAIFVSPTGKIVLNGNLNILGGNVRYAGYGLTVQGVLQQKGALTAVSNGPTTFNAVVQLDQGLWTQEAGATVDMQLRFSNGVGLSTGSSWLQKGNINMRLDQSSNGVWCLQGNKVWAQQGQVNMTVSNFSAGIALTTGTWLGMGDVVVNVLDSGSHGIYCYNPNVNVVGDVLIRENGACFSLLTPTRCLLKPEPCP